MTVFHERAVHVGSVETIYRLYEPADRTAAMPVILFLHGAGESGADGLRPTTVGIGPAIVRSPERFPALVVFPQASRGYGWRGFNLDAAIAALADVTRTYDIDEDRVYVTGISMGGYGTCAVSLARPERFAAAAVICGGMDRGGLRVADVAARLAHIPHWLFHGDADTVIPVEHSRFYADALRSAGGDVRYTEYAGVQHNSWDRAYAEPELLPWMLAQRRRAAKPHLA